MNVTLTEEESLWLREYLLQTEVIGEDELDVANKESILEKLE